MNYKRKGAKTLLLKAAIEKFKKFLITTEKSDETVRSYGIDLSHFEEFLEDKYNCPLYMDEIKVEDIEDFLYYLKKKISKLPPEAEISIPSVPFGTMHTKASCVSGILPWL